MNLRRVFIHTILYLPFVFHKVTRSGSFGPCRAEDVDGPVPAGGNPLKAGLWKHHVKQFHESSCSVATVVSVVNALRGADAAPITQMDILETVRTAFWKERMSEKGHKGRRGLPLPVLGEVVTSSLDQYGIGYAAVETVQAQKDPRHSKTIKEVLRRRLNDFEKKGNCLIIAHFDQGAYVPTLNIPHISPVGGFDPHTGEVILLDVDPQQEKPYRVRFDTFYKGLASDYNHVFRPFGYRSGGYVYIKLH
ncbi:MAG: phytochelatin synthase [Desulfobacteraceae bacterium]|nr:MAG: phytochelatin synthase [Desulfobacteraceae bacterium]